MRTNFLHGIRTLEYDDGTKEINTVDISVIGIVGTAPDSLSRNNATLFTGSPLLSNQIQFTSITGAAGNSWSVEIEMDSTAENVGFTYTTNPDGSQKLHIFVNGEFTVNDVVEKAQTVNQSRTLDNQLIVNAVNEGNGIVLASPLQYLSGGYEEPFPLNTPALIAGSPKKAALLGGRGTLPKDIADIFNQDNALLVVVRVKDDKDATKQQQNIIDGVKQLEKSKQLTGVTPRIIIAPDFSAIDTVAAQVEATATKLRGVGYIDSPTAATAEDVVRRRQSYGDRVEILRPRIFTTSDITGASRAYSATAAGLRARIDNDGKHGFWWSKSNQNIYGVTGVEQIDDFIIGETNCTANLLNAEQVSTIIRYDGFRHWGNYLCSLDPQWSFECVRRTADVIEDSIAIAMMNDFIDRPIDVHLGGDIIETINAYIRKLYEMGAINGGRAWLDSELNTKESFAAGKIYINVEFAPKSPAQTITITYRINNDYTVDEFSSLLKQAA
ncbi:phage tail sheath subtilisin-like domain-containing protein [Escherichia coli]|uniref:phage tail sheath family protein n=1 Tax=Escherichia coli TaxID=562 RepID=UPI0010EC0E2B|nr:phage tail sheath C-terminal domain-containing protein [Escherichia coli]EJF8031346.1 phage tail sheath subtilisin-like domain-containing protein [Escherichia coli]MDF1396532.1 phage tail sheath C-terminal domain-containing protein [Escherichia coli]GDF31922.1 phage tail sheath protein [Escherichia coli]HAL6342357.1 phage tail protein [Escherichia coli]HAX4872331.1 phage tail protein [Escherichia coli]